MAAAQGQKQSESGAFPTPAAWLIAPTLFLLLGQAMAAVPWRLRPSGAALLLVPLMLLVTSGRRRLGMLLTLSTLAFFLGYYRHRQLIFPEFPANHLRSLITANARWYLEGRLASEPEKLGDRTRWKVRAERIWHPKGAEEVSGDLLVTLRYVARDWRYGDLVRFWVRPSLPRSSGNPDGFDYAAYLSRRAIYVTGFLESDREVELLERLHGLRAFIEDLRRQIRRFVVSRFSPHNGALLNALVVGDVGAIAKEKRAAFTAAGVSHVLSISGLHVAMLGLVAFALVRYGGALSSVLMLRCNLFKVAALLSFVAVIFYTALAGAMVPTVRSAIMIGVYQVAVLLDREEEVFASLTVAALLIGLIWAGVVAEMSFQLSFLAVLFIVWGMRKMHQWWPLNKSAELHAERGWLYRRLRAGSKHLAVPLLATIGTGPLIAHYFGHLSLAGFVANPVIVPLVGFVIVPLGLAIGIFALLAPPVAVVLAGVAEPLVSLTAWLVENFARFPFAHVSVPSPNPFEIAALYSLLMGLFLLRRKSHRFALLGMSMAVLAADAAYWWHQRHQRAEIRVTHLNVGQGDAAVVELPNSQVLLVDAGGSTLGDFDTGENVVAPFLRSRKILKVDYLILSHARVDHYGGMSAIVREFSPREFWSGTMDGQGPRFEELAATLNKRRIPIVAINNRQPCRMLGVVSLCVVFPPPRKSAGASVVLSLEFGKLRYLFTGDLDRGDEASLLEQGDGIRSAVIKVPRHGSGTASSEAFIGAVRPGLAIISGGRGRQAELERETVVAGYRQVGAVVLTTRDDGAIIVESDGSTLRYTGYQSGKKGVIGLGSVEEGK